METGDAKHTSLGATLEDLLLETLEEALANAGFERFVDQRCADSLMERALEALRDDDASMQQAARSAVDAYSSELIRERDAAHPDGCKCEECWWEWIDRAYHLAVDRELMAHG